MLYRRRIKTFERHSQHLPQRRDQRAEERTIMIVLFPLFKTHCDMTST